MDLKTLKPLPSEEFVQKHERKLAELIYAGQKQCEYYVTVETPSWSTEFNLFLHAFEVVFENGFVVMFGYTRIVRSIDEIEEGQTYMICLYQR